MPMPNDRILPQIEHFVVLMLENRSLDAACGWLYEHDRPNRVLGRDLGRPYDGLRAGAYSNRFKRKLGGIETHPVAKVPRGNLKLPSLNPNEEYTSTNNQLYGDAERTVHATPPAGTPARMQGFLQDYYGKGILTQNPEEILLCYTPEGLPVLNGLAKNYAISDRWFSSVPTQTNPNRAFLACGTSLGRESNLKLTADESFDHETVWNALSKHKVEWTLYFHEEFPAGSGKCYTQNTFPFINSARNPSGRKRFAWIDEFWADAPAGRLPPFTFLEPKWSYGIGGPFVRQGNDYHPPAGVGPAEILVQRVYEALTRNPEAWKKTLLVLTFDEHGGTYDHVPPPFGAPRPDRKEGKNGFRFDRYGVRVPTILVSPYVPAGTVFRSHGPLEYDHCSLTATILKWQGIDPGTAGLNERVKTAPTFEEVLVETAREDVPTVHPPVDEVFVAPASAAQSEAVERFQALPVEVGKGISEAVTDEPDLLRRMEIWERTGALEEALATE
jgi:phospholipase C